MSWEPVPTRLSHEDEELLQPIGIGSAGRDEDTGNASS